MSVQTHRSLNSAVGNAASVAKSLQSEGGDEEGGFELQGVEEQEQPSLVNQNGWKRGEDGTTVYGSKEQHLECGLEGLTTQVPSMGSMPVESFSDVDEAASSLVCEPFEASELQIIEDALRRRQRVEEGKFEASNGLQDVARLLKKVQSITARNKGPSLKSERSNPDSSVVRGQSGEENTEQADIRQAVQAASQTALASAKAVETVVNSLNRNSQAVENLCKALATFNSLQAPSEESVTGQEQTEDEEEQRNMLEIELQQAEIAKSLIRQNRVTHWVLGFIVVSSLLWRYGVVKFVKSVNDTIQNPFQGITDMFKPKEGRDEDNTGLQLKLPSILTGEEEAENGKRHAEKEKEDKMFDVGRIFHGHEPK